MSSRQLQQNLYGFPSPLSKQAYPPIQSNRAPLTTDYAPIGSIFVNQLTNSAYVLTSIVSNSATWDLINNAGGSGSFTTLSVSGLSTLGATNILGTANVNVSGAAVTTIGTGGTGSVSIGNATGGVVLPAGGNVAVTPGTQTIASPASTGTLNTRVGVIKCTGFTTAAAGTQTFTISDNKITTSSFVMVTAANLNASTNGALISVQGVTVSANTMAITVKNNGGGALGAGDDVLLSFVINS